MKTGYIQILFLLIIIIAVSCDKINDDSSDITAKLISHTGCKNDLKSAAVNTPDTLSCVKYIYDFTSGTLKLTHINAGFNCCPGKLTCTAVMHSDTIVISEYEEKADCRCNCLYDLEIEITEVNPQKYVICFVEPYAPDEEDLIFDVDLNKSPEGSFCVVRTNYPWGM